MVFDRQPGNSDGVFQLRMGNIGFCKLLLCSNQNKDRRWDAAARACLFFCAGGVHWAKKTRSNSAYFAYSVYSAYTTSFDFFPTSAWVDDCQSAIVNERREQAQVLYVIPVCSKLGRLPLVPEGETRTIHFDMRGESADHDFPGAFCDKSS
jgi:hypothetical protein